MSCMPSPQSPAHKSSSKHIPLHLDILLISISRPGPAHLDRQTTDLVRSNSLTKIPPLPRPRNLFMCVPYLPRQASDTTTPSTPHTRHPLPRVKAYCVRPKADRRTRYINLSSLIVSRLPVRSTCTIIIGWSLYLSGLRPGKIIPCVLKLDPPAFSSLPTGSFFFLWLDSGRVRGMDGRVVSCRVDMT